MVAGTSPHATDVLLTSFVVAVAVVVDVAVVEARLTSAAGPSARRLHPFDVTFVSLLQTQPTPLSDTVASRHCH